MRADIYAVGATLYYLLTGQPPFDARDLRELVARVNTEPPSVAASRAAARFPRDSPRSSCKCLSKAPAQRPSSYTALAERCVRSRRSMRGQRRWGSRVLGDHRGLRDAVSLPFTIWNAATAGFTMTGQAAPAQNPWTWLLNVVYFFVLEARWGASLGKRLFGLRLSSPGGPGWVMRVARRTIVFHIPWLVIALVLVTFGPLGPHEGSPPRRKLDAQGARRPATCIEGVATLTLVAVSSSPRDGTTAGPAFTRSSAARESCRQRRPGCAREPHRAAAPTIDAATLSLGKRYGPFRALSDEREGDARLIVGFDPVLRRQVWIHEASPQTRPIDAVRRDLSRTGRLHWLTGRRNGADNWDAFEAPDGQPLLLALQTSTPQWTTLKSWLLDLSAELVASATDGSTPALRLDRLWIRDDGRLVLLDFPAPGTPGVSSETAHAADLSPDAAAVGGCRSSRASGEVSCRADAAVRAHAAPIVVAPESAARH